LLSCVNFTYGIHHSFLNLVGPNNASARARRLTLDAVWLRGSSLPVCGVGFATAKVSHSPRRRLSGCHALSIRFLTLRRSHAKLPVRV
jgi:hypothetical protein